MWCGEWCWWRGGVPYPSTNNQPNPSVTAILGQCLSLSTGTSVSQFVSHSSQHTDMLCMTLRESLTGVSYAQAARLQGHCWTACVSLTEALCLSVTSTGIVEHWDATQKLTGNGKNLHILTVISTGIVTTRRWYLSFYWVWERLWVRCLYTYLWIDTFMPHLNCL